MSLSRVTRIARGTPIATDRAKGERLSRVTGLAAFASDALGSVAYATEAILLILGLARGAALPRSMAVSVAIAARISS